jgi:hypothetical protein
MAQAVSRRPLTAETRICVPVSHVGFVVDKVALKQICSQLFCFPLLVSSHCGSVLTYHLGDEE